MPIELLIPLCLGSGICFRFVAEGIGDIWSLVWDIVRSV